MKSFMKNIAVIATSFLMLSATAYAADYDFAGNFRQDNDVLKFNFSVGADGTATIFSSSWDNGGFDPILAIWTSSGALVNQQDDGGKTGTTFSNGVAYDYGVWDSYYSIFLTSGNYIATVTQYANFANSNLLADGFQQDNNPNFTFDLGFGGATQPLFNGVWGTPDPRTSDWAFHILNVSDANIDAVPEPSTMILVSIGLAGLAFVRKKYRN